MTMTARERGEDGGVWSTDGGENGGETERPLERYILGQREGPMFSTSSPSRALAFAGVVVGLVSGCAHRSGARATSPAADPSVTAEDIQRNPGEPIEQVLQSRFPGVEVTRTPDGSIAIRIRGVTSFNGPPSRCTWSTGSRSRRDRAGR